MCFEGFGDIRQRLDSGTVMQNQYRKTKGYRKEKRKEKGNGTIHGSKTRLTGQITLRVLLELRDPLVEVLLLLLAILQRSSLQLGVVSLSLRNRVSDVSQRKTNRIPSQIHRSRELTFVRHKQWKQKKTHHEQFLLGWRDVVDQVRAADTQHGTTVETAGQYLYLLNGSQVSEEGNTYDPIIFAHNFAPGMVAMVRCEKLLEKSCDSLNINRSDCEGVCRSRRSLSKCLRCCL